MSGEKTEQPTDKKRRDARRDGQVAHSKDFTQQFTFILVFGWLLLDGRRIFNRLAELIVLPTTMTHLQIEESLYPIIIQLLTLALTAVGPLLGLAFLSSIAADVLQIGPLFSTKAITPSLKKLDVVQNIKNLVSVKSLVELLKSLLKITSIGLLTWFVLQRNLGLMTSLVYGDPGNILYALGKIASEMMLGVVCIYLPLVAFDLFWQRRVLTKQLMMRKDEIKREYKENEGDPQIKQERRRIGQEINSGNFQAAKKASVIVTNPTHYAVALYYKANFTPLPVVLLKGEGDDALEIIKIGRQAEVPIVQNVLLARGLYHLAQEEGYIPTEFLEPVAELIFSVAWLRGKDMSEVSATDTEEESPATEGERHTDQPPEKDSTE